MAKKENLDKDLKNLKTRIQEGNVVVGTDKVLKSLRKKELSKIFLASNCPQQTKEDITHYAKLVEIPVLVLSLNNEEFGLFCKKNFFVSVLGIKE